MQLDSVLVWVTTAEDMRRLVRAGGEIWERGGHTINARGRYVWAHGLVKLPAAVALRMGLVALGPELEEIAGGDDGGVAAPASRQRSSSRRRNGPVAPVASTVAR